MHRPSSVSRATDAAPGEPAPREPYGPPPGHTRLQLEVQWDGTGFVGWQSQPHQRSVQDTLQTALQTLAPALSPVALRPVAAGRTDAGVHAEQMTVHWDISEQVRLPPERLLRALNGQLPPDLGVLTLHAAAAGFHARFSCLGRRYVYRMLTAPQRRPLWAGRALHVPQPLDTAAMQDAGLRLLGEHDFAAFATREERQTRRTLHRLDVQPRGEVLELHVEGESFLRHMVRGLVGTLLLVGRGELAPAAVTGVLASGDRAQAGPNVPPHGLYFSRALYPPGADAQA